MDHFCPSRPGVAPGLQDHFYTSVWCKTRPPGPPLPPSRELVDPTAPSWEFPGIVPRNSWNTAGPLSWYHARTRGPPSRVLLGLLSTPVALLGESISLATSVRDHNCTTRYLKCISVTLLKDRIRRILLCFFQRTVYFPVSSRELHSYQTGR